MEVSATFITNLTKPSAIQMLSSLRMRYVFARNALLKKVPDLLQAYTTTTEQIFAIVVKKHQL